MIPGGDGAPASDVAEGSPDVGGGLPLPGYAQPTAGGAAVYVDPTTVTTMGDDLETVGSSLSGIDVAPTLGIAGALPGSDTHTACETISGVIESVLAVYAQASRSVGVSAGDAADAYVATDDANAFRFTGQMRW